jgi:hypothetical protein
MLRRWTKTNEEERKTKNKEGVSGEGKCSTVCTGSSGVVGLRQRPR